MDKRRKGWEGLLILHDGDPEACAGPFSSCCRPELVF